MPDLIHNPILPGFHPDPSLIRVGDDYYLATSTFEWFPGVALSIRRSCGRFEPMPERATLARQDAQRITFTAEIGVNYSIPSTVSEY